MTSGSLCAFTLAAQDAPLEPMAQFAQALRAAGATPNELAGAQVGGTASPGGALAEFLAARAPSDFVCVAIVSQVFVSEAQQLRAPVGAQGALTELVEVGKLLASCPARRQLVVLDVGVKFDAPPPQDTPAEAVASMQETAYRAALAEAFFDDSLRGVAARAVIATSREDGAPLLPRLSAALEGFLAGEIFEPDETNLTAALWAAAVEAQGGARPMLLADRAGRGIAVAARGGAGVSPQSRAARAFEEMGEGAGAAAPEAEEEAVSAVLQKAPQEKRARAAPKLARKRMVEQPLEAPNAAAAPSAPPVVEAAPKKPQVSLGRLNHNAPKRMKVGAPGKVAVAISADLTDAAADVLSGPISSHDLQITSVMSVELRDPEDAFDITPLTASLQPIDRSALRKAGFMRNQSEQAKDRGVWRWRVTPKRAGAHPLTIHAAAYVTNEAGALIPAPEQNSEFTVKVRVNYARMAGGVLGWASVALAGFVLIDLGVRPILTAQSLSEAFTLMSDAAREMLRALSGG